MDPDQKGFTTPEVIDVVKGTESTHPWQIDIRQAVHELCKPEANKLGLLFRKFHKRNFAGKSLVKLAKVHGSNRWIVNEVSGARPKHVPHVPHVPPASPSIRASSSENEVFEL